MGRIVVVENVSLDGVMQSPGRADEDTRGGFDRGGWATSWMMKDPEAARASMSGRTATRAMLFGHRTYDDLVGHWLSVSDPNPFTEVLRNTPKYVASRDESTVLPHPNSVLVTGDVIGRIAEIRRSTDGDIVVLGSGELVRDLAEAGLVDEYVVTTIPVVLGSGSRLFGTTFAEFEVLSTMTSAAGASVTRYGVRQPTP
jgi:dihydrofolate reductase